VNEEQKQTAQEYWANFPEAPYSDTFKWVDGAGYEHMTTVRQWSGQGLYSAIAKMIEIIGETGGRPANNRPPMAPAPAPDAAAAILAADGNKQAAASVQAASEAVPSAPNGKQWLTMEINRIVIKPEPLDTYTLECYAPGHRYPDLRATKRKLDVIASYVKHVTSADPSKPLDASVNAVAYYLEGKPKDGGGFWLDLYHLRNK